MHTDIFASVSEVSGVYSSSYTRGSDSPKVGNEPFGTVETNNIDDVKGFKAQRNERLAKGINLLTILFPGPCSVRNVFHLDPLK